MRICILVALMLGAVEINAVDVQREKRSLIWTEVCYGSLGCFSNGPPFFSPPQRPLSVVPLSPDIIQTKFLLYTRQNKDAPQKLDARHIQQAASVWTHFKVRQTQIVINAFGDNVQFNKFYEELTDELLKHGDYNVILVDWFLGSLPPYTQATANARVVGAQVAELIHSYINGTNMTAADFHVIGHSLGAQTAGYAGEKVPGLGRITGLDPAGPYFENTDPRVRLDVTDAMFVDVIHTDTASLGVIGLGTKTESGLSDFFPNLGHDQPGCGTFVSPTKVLEYGFGIEGLQETFGCNHLRAFKLFLESINSLCPFLSIPCASEADFINNLCDSCAGVECSYMGFHANKKPPPKNQPRKYYLTTGSREPFCQYHYTVTIKFSLGQGSDQKGTIYLDIKGSLFTFKKVSLTGDGNAHTFKPGQSYKFYVMLPSDVGNIQSVTFFWTSESLISDILTLNIFNNPNSKLYVDEIDIYREEAGIDAHFCTGGQSVKSGRSLTVSRTC